MRRSLHLFIGILFATASGCTALFPSDRYVGDGSSDGGGQTIDAADRGSLDAGTLDAGPDAPSTPVIELTPSEPFTNDDLSVHITTESSDPLGGTITYEYQWLRGTDVVIEGETTLPAAETTKHEEWTVVVTPVADGERRGAPARALVTIQNSPPIVTTVALNTYRPIAGEILTADSGIVIDADDDPTTLSYRWRVDGVVASGATGSSFEIPHDGTPGVEYSVELTVTDDDDAASAPVTAGPAVSLSGEPRWRQIWPDRMQIATSALDVLNERIVFTTRPHADLTAQTWEYDLARERFVQLFPAGTPPDVDAVSVFTTGGGAELLMLPLFEDLALHRLDVGHRGRESWNELELKGAITTGDVLAGVFDAARDRIVAVVYEADEPYLYTVDVSTGMVAHVASITAPVDGGAFVLIPERDEVLVLGGGSRGVPHDKIHRLDLANIESGFTELSARLQQPRVLPLAAVDPFSSRIVYGMGWVGDGIESSDWSSMNFDGSDVTPFPLTGTTPQRPGFLGPSVAWAPKRERLLVMPSSPELFVPPSFQVYEIDLEAGHSDAVHVFDINAPGPLADGMSSRIMNGREYLFGGRTADGDVSQALWYVRRGARGEYLGWRRVDSAGPAPGPRFGQLLSSTMDRLWVFGGKVTYADYAPTSLTWAFDGAQWHRYEDDTPIPERSGSVVFEGCSRDEVCVLGGRSPDSTATRAAEVRCGAASCDWQELPGAGTVPSASALVDGSAGSFGGTVVLMMGRDGTAYIYNKCRDEWSTASVEGPVPDLRGTHSVLLGPWMYDGTGVYRVMYDVAANVVTFAPFAVAADSSAPPERSGYVALSGSGGRALVFGGHRRGAGHSFHGDLWGFIP